MSSTRGRSPQLTGQSRSGRGSSSAPSSSFTLAFSQHATPAPSYQLARRHRDLSEEVPEARASSPSASAHGPVACGPVEDRLRVVSKGATGVSVCAGATCYPLLRRSLDTSGPFLASLWQEIPDTDFFPAAAGTATPTLRLVYIAAAAVALAPRINDTVKRRFGGGYSRDSMPRGPGDAAPEHVIAAVSSSALVKSTTVITWHDFLDLMKLVRARLYTPLLVVESNAVSLAMSCRSLKRTSRRRRHAAETVPVSACHSLHSVARRARRVAPAASRGRTRLGRIRPLSSLSRTLPVAHRRTRDPRRPRRVLLRNALASPMLARCLPSQRKVSSSSLESCGTRCVTRAVT